MPETGAFFYIPWMPSSYCKKSTIWTYILRKTFHLLTKKNISPLLFKLAVNRYSVKIFNKLLAYPESLLMKDYQEVVDRNKWRSIVI
jgi:hypothetical protein